MQQTLSSKDDKIIQLNDTNASCVGLNTSFIPSLFGENTFGIVKVDSLVTMIVT